MHALVAQILFLIINPSPQLEEHFDQAVHSDQKLSSEQFPLHVVCSLISSDELRQKTSCLMEHLRLLVLTPLPHLTEHSLHSLQEFISVGFSSRVLSNMGSELRAHSQICFSELEPAQFGLASCDGMRHWRVLI